MQFNNRPKVCIQGLGFVGAAMAVATAIADDEHGKPLYEVTGVDLPNSRGLKIVNLINQGIFPFPTSDEKLIKATRQANNQGNLKAATNESFYGSADIVVVDISLDIPYLDNEPQLNFEKFKKALQAIAKRIKKGALVIIETTVPPGTCEKVVVPSFSEDLKKRGMSVDDILVAHSPERVMPGENYLESITNFWRVYSGYTEEAADACEAFLKNVVNTKNYPLTRLSSPTASETLKVMENTYRAVNIAFLDEWSKYAEKVGIDMFEIVDAIKKRPTHSNIMSPGLGVGGYCLTKDPMFAPASARQLFGKEMDFPFSKMAVYTNHNMPLHTVSRLKHLLNGSLEGKKILVCGVSYREDVGDTRNSPSETLVKGLQNSVAQIKVHDPYVEYWEEMDFTPEKILPQAENFDACIFAVAHKDYKQLDLHHWVSGSNPVILDASSVFDKKQILKFYEQNLRFYSIGRG